MDKIKPHHWITSVGRMSRRKPPKQCQPAAYYDQQAIDTLRAEVESLRKDAERYRWIRDSSNPIATQTVGEFGDQELDEAIDHYLSDAIDGEKKALE